ncbi:hypothetical protein SFHH103_psfHH103d_391 (plasmid) [Sinorhizobium fredii HH103]|nr:hypothetical protein SFHH103_04257 [Sinorhizobium fredii HH103]CEO91594.1 hypothetical protein SFHH103_psfHH103d_391 [Sinorhizobium fredii HH103]
MLAPSVVSVIFFSYRILATYPKTTFQEETCEKMPLNSLAS